MRELSVQSGSSTVNDSNRESIQAEYTQLTQEIDRIALSTTYNDTALLTGYGNNVDTGSTALTTSNTTGVTNVNISGASTGTYTFADSTTDGEITMGNGTVTQTIRIATLLDGTDVATGTSAVANFDRLGIQVTLVGANAGNATGSYTDGDLDATNIVINGGTGGSFQVGPDDGINNRIEVGIQDMRATGAPLNLGGTSVATLDSSRSSITAIDQAIKKVSNQRGELGAFQNRLAFTISFTENEIENIQNSEASISDADVAAEVTAFTRAQILSQAATSMLAQANVAPQQALSLLQ
jgi:flagellin